MRNRQQNTNLNLATCIPQASSTLLPASHVVVLLEGAIA